MSTQYIRYPQPSGGSGTITDINGAVGPSITITGGTGISVGTLGNTITVTNTTTDTGITQLTGDVTAGPGSGSQVATIASNAVTNVKLAQMPAHTFKGNNTGSTANALDLTQTQLTAELNQFTTTLQGVVPGSGGGTANFLRADGTWTAPSGTGANTALSNLIATSINQDLLPDLSANHRNLGSSSKVWFGGNIVEMDFYDSAFTQRGAIFGSATPAFNITATSGIFNLKSANDTSTQNINLSSGNASAGSSGDINLFSGTATTTRGTIHINPELRIDGTTSGYVGIKATSTPTSYTVILPGSQGAASTFLQNDGAGNLSWVAATAGANTSLSNLITTSINQNLLPDLTLSRDLGSSTLAWNRLYIPAIFSSTNHQVIDVNAQKLYDTTTLASVDWQNRRLVSDTTIKLDWSGTNIDVNTRKIINVVDPTAAQDAATKAYVDSGTGNAANKFLSNLTSPTALNQDLIPGIDGTINIGSSTLRIFTHYFYNQIAYGSTSGNIAFLTPATITSYSLKWPNAQGTASTFLQNDGTGNLSWATPTDTGITQLTGDATAGPGSGSQVLTLATVNGNVGTFGSSTSIPTITVNAKGLITAASGNAVIAPAGTLSGTTLNATVVSSSLTSVGTITSGTWNGTTIAIANGGTGQTTAAAAFTALSPLTTAGDIIYENNTPVPARLPIGSSGQLLTVVAGLPAWQTAAPTATPNKETFVLSGTNITNQYLDLAHVAQTNSILFQVKGSGDLLEGASYDYSVNYTGGAGGNTRITFLNDLATGGAAALVATDVVQINYIY